MCGVICAAAVGRVHAPSNSSQSILILDPSEDETSSLEGSGCFAFLFSVSLGDSGTQVPESEVVWSNWQATSSFTEDELVQVKEQARVGAQGVWKAIKTSVAEIGLSARVKEEWKDVELKLGAKGSSIDDDDAKMEI